jgi:hypothetical protein
VGSPAQFTRSAGTGSFKSLSKRSQLIRDVDIHDLDIHDLDIRNVDPDQQLRWEFEMTSRRRKRRTTPRVPQESVQTSLDITCGFANIRLRKCRNAFERARARTGVNARPLFT